MGRGQIVVENMALVANSKWERFAQTLGLDERLEFNEGDIGLSGGLAVKEPANLNPTTHDMIRRFGGSTSQAMQWPEEDNGGDDDEDRFDKIEKLIQKAMKRMSSGGEKKGRGTAGGSSGQAGSGTGGDDANDASGEEEHSGGEEDGANDQ